jgi:hypothetical protein
VYAERTAPSSRSIATGASSSRSTGRARPTRSAGESSMPSTSSPRVDWRRHRDTSARRARGLVRGRDVQLGRGGKLQAAESEQGDSGTGKCHVPAAAASLPRWDCVSCFSARGDPTLAP